MYDEDKKIYAILVFGYEVTEQVLAKNKIQELHEAHARELEEKVQQRTHELEAANEMLLQKNSELLSFAYVSSHDLQEPLRKIQMFTSRILSKEYDVLSDDGKDAFRRISDAAQRMQTLIQDLLAYSHAGVADKKFEIIDLRKIVEEVIIDHSESIAEKSATIEIVETSLISVNALQFRQVIQNLISNALKFSRNGTPPHIVVRSKINTGFQLQAAAHGRDLSRLIPNKEYCHISFSDNGIGFDPQYKERIFEVFQRLHNKNNYSGTGIGLAIVKKIIEHHDGFITASSEPNEGATFDIFIPAN
jgi:light-regulated signal transduction histidine kinase (bacteriophytochrome)